MSGFSATDRAVVSWVTILCASHPMTKPHSRALRELCALDDVIDRMETGVMQQMNAAVMELARCWKPGEPVPFRCIDYCRLALLDFHLARVAPEKGA